MNDELSKCCFCILSDKSYLPKIPLTDIYHYTSAVAFNSILFNSEDSDEITLWSSRFDCLNDKTEGKFVTKLYEEVCWELLNDKIITKGFFNTIIGLRPSEKALFHFRPEQKKLSEMKECSRYITSFSTKKDSLPLWNYYSKGNYYEGFNIGFYLNEFIECLKYYFNDKYVNVYMYPVIYHENEFKDLIKKIVLELYSSYDGSNQDLLTGFISQRLFDWSLCFKCDKFEHENEVRVVIDVAEDENDVQVKYRIYKGYIIPYIEIKTPKSVVSSVSFGPLLLEENEKEQQKRILKEMLRSKNYDADVEASEIPVRY